jgi:hypothetical protein
MNSQRFRFSVYLIGITPLGLCYDSLKQAVDSDILFVGICLGYLTGLRFVGGALDRNRSQSR